MYNICKVCGTNYRVPPGRCETRKTCSLECRSVLTRNKPKVRIVLTCEFCGCEFETYPSRLRQRFCSRICQGPVVHTWSADLAYTIGLIASDGTLERGNNRVSFCNKEQELLDWMLNWMPRSSIYPHGDGTFQVCCVWPNFYQFLLEVGLSPAKSLTMKELGIPDEWFFHFYRGLHDGDGTTHYHKNSLHLALCSFAPVFRSWLRGTIERLTMISVSEGKQSLHLYGKKAKQFAQLVWTENAPCLERKRPRDL